MHIKIKEEEGEGRISIASARGCQAMCVIAPDTNQSQKGAWVEVGQMFAGLFLNQIFSLSYSEAKAKAEHINHPLGQNRKGRKSLSKGEQRAQDGFCYSQAKEEAKRQVGMWRGQLKWKTCGTMKQVPGHRKAWAPIR